MIGEGSQGDEEEEGEEGGGGEDRPQDRGRHLLVSSYPSKLKDLTLTCIIALGKASEKKYGIIWEFFPT